MRSQLRSSVISGPFPVLIALSRLEHGSAIRRARVREGCAPPNGVNPMSTRVSPALTGRPSGACSLAYTPGSRVHARLPALPAELET